MWGTAAILVAVSCVFAASAVEKSVSSAQRSNQWHPVVVAGRQRRFRATMYSLSALADGLIAVGLFVIPSSAAIAGLAATAAYTVVAVRTDGLWASQSGCRCAGPILDVRNRRQLVVRNGSIGLGLLLLLASLPESVELPAVFGGGLILAVGTLALRRIQSHSGTQIAEQVSTK